MPSDSSRLFASVTYPLVVRLPIGLRPEIRQAAGGVLRPGVIGQHGAALAMCVRSVSRAKWSYRKSLPRTDCAPTRSANRSIDVNSPACAAPHELGSWEAQSTQLHRRRPFLPPFLRARPPRARLVGRHSLPSYGRPPPVSSSLPPARRPPRARLVGSTVYPATAARPRPANDIHVSLYSCAHLTSRTRPVRPGSTSSRSVARHELRPDTAQREDLPVTTRETVRPTRRARGGGGGARRRKREGFCEPGSSSRDCPPHEPSSWGRSRGTEEKTGRILRARQVAHETVRPTSRARGGGRGARRRKREDPRARQVAHETVRPTSRARGGGRGGARVETGMACEAGLTSLKPNTHPHCGPQYPDRPVPAGGILANSATESPTTQQRCPQTTLAIPGPGCSRCPPGHRPGCAAARRWAHSRCSRSCSRPRTSARAAHVA